MADPHANPHPPTTHDYAKEADQPSLLYIVWAAVLGLALANIGLATTGFGGKYALAVQLGIGAVQAFLVCYYFMHLKQSEKVVTLTALASVFWVGILFVLFMADYMSRHLVVVG